MAVSADVLALVGFACEALLYGAYCVLFTGSLCVLCAMWRARRMSRVIVALHCLLFVACTLHFALEFTHFYTYLGTRGVAGFGAEDRRQFIADCTLSVADFLGDLILIYRCWVLWGRSLWVAAIPLLCAVGGLASAAVVGHLVWGSAGTTVARAVVPLGLASFALPLCTNALTTALIVTRIWWAGCRGDGGCAGGARRAAHVVESGMLYFAVQCAFVVVYGRDDASELVLVAIAVQTYGIASTLIIIQVGLGLSSEHIAARTDTRSGLSFSSVGAVAGGLASDVVELDDSKFVPVHRGYGTKATLVSRTGSSMDSACVYVEGHAV